MADAQLQSSDDQIAALLGDEMLAQLEHDNAEVLQEWLRELVADVDRDDDCSWLDLEPSERKYLLLLAMVGLRRSLEWAESRRETQQ